MSLPVYVIPGAIRYAQVHSRLILILAVFGLSAQQDSTIRVDVRRVLVPVIVADKKGHHVTGLRKSDFRVFEDGVRQDIASFSTDATASVDDLAAISSPSMPAPASPTGPRRTYVVCIDTLHTAPASAGRLREALVNLFDKEKPGDAQYVLIAIGRRMQVLQPATSNPQVLLLKLRNPAFQAALAGLDSSALNAELQNIRTRMDDFCKRCACGTRPSRGGCDAETETLKQNVDAEAERWSAPARGLAEQFTSVVGELAKLPTARTLILISDGFNIDPKREFYSVVSAYVPNRPQFKLEGASEIEPSLRDAIRTASERNVIIYAVDSRGGAAPSLASTGPMDAGAASAPTGGGVISRSAASTTRGTTLQSSSSLQANPFSDEISATMDRLAHSTGGLYLHGSADLNKELRTALADGREYYVLTYVPKNNAPDGRFRTITVELSDKALNIRAKQGYWAPAVAQ